MLAARSEAVLEKEAHALNESGMSASCIKLDFCDSESIKRCADQVGQVDILVNVAGTNVRQRFEQYTKAEYNHILQTNLHGIVELTQLVGAKMIAAGKGGKVIHIGSLMSLVGTTLVTYNGINELDLQTGDFMFEWNSKDHVALSEVYREAPEGWSAGIGHWDYLHLNSVDKAPSGNYLVSGRYSSTIYLISRNEGHIIWRLGGQDSSFVHSNNFTITAQHDARLISENSTMTVISLFNNGADELTAVEETSSGLIIALETSAEPKRARVLNRYDRPDGLLSRARGNFQVLENGNAFLCWSRNAYISEHSEDGRCLMEGKTVTRGLASYRAYKFNFTGVPSIHELALKSLSFCSGQHMLTTHYVSWNGATEVRSWNFYSVEGHPAGREGGKANYTLIGNAVKTGFETTFVSQARANYFAVEALDVRGATLGLSEVQEVELKCLAYPPVPGAGLPGSVESWYYTSAAVYFPWLVIMIALVVAILHAWQNRSTDAVYVAVKTNEN